MSQKRQPEEGEVGASSDGSGSPDEKRQKIRFHGHHFMDKERSVYFNNKLSLPIFTGSRIEGEDTSAIFVALVDALTGQVVTTGPESSLKVEIVVLEGDFEFGEDGNWTFDEFKNNIVREREGKRTLLTGDVFIDLNEGIGILGELSFTDNSSWTRSRKFRLGARVPDGHCNGIRVREAKTEPFMVKDHRGECECMSLREKILGSGMSARMWEVTVEHARTCILTDQHWNDVITYEKADVLGISSPAPQNSSLGLENMYSNFPSPVKGDGFGFTYSSIPSPDIFSVGGMRGLDAYTLEAIGSMEPRYEQDSQSTSLYDGCSSQALFSSMPQYNSSFCSPSIGFISESPADFGVAFKGFIDSQLVAAAPAKPRRGWRKLSCFDWDEQHS
ncbi:hypothetical protein B296_00016244 [Ensete ventricosum]|uniref:Uncharacterized protein n=1 Tax=Ensete ventricosum TaxID=4639 RepID=A0A426ZD54_ENSVE|nr:hypothetical protein B296_00016244 [Ensete ventricosum]